MNMKQFAGWAFMLGALAAAIGSMATVDWWGDCVSDGNGNTGCTYYGLRKYKVTMTDSNGNTQTETGDLKDIPDDGGQIPYDAGTKILEAGIPAIVCMAAGPVLYCLYAAGKIKSVAMLIAGVLVSLSSVVLVVLAMLLYAGKFYISYCFTMYFVGALLFLTATAVLVVAIFSNEISKPKVAFAMAVLLTGIAIVAASLALVNWFHLSQTQTDTNGNTVTLDVWYGVKNYKIRIVSNGAEMDDSGTLQSYKQKLEDNNSDGSKTVAINEIQRVIDAGNLALGFGIVGLVFAFVGLLLAFAMVAGKEGRVIAAAVCSNVLAALFVLIGTMTWARKLHVGYSFIVFVLSGFLVLIGVAFFVAGVSVSTDNGKVALATSADRTDSGHVRMPDHA